MPRGHAKNGRLHGELMWNVKAYIVSGLTIVSLVVSILLNEPKGSCRARLDRTLEGLECVSTD
jgi:hypothetical protein